MTSSKGYNEPPASLKDRKRQGTLIGILRENQIISQQQLDTHTAKVDDSGFERGGLGLKGSIKVKIKFNHE
jgi:hypothetical protein